MNSSQEYFVHMFVQSVAKRLNYKEVELGFNLANTIERRI